MLALIKNNTVISIVAPDGWFELPDGARVSPAYHGWSNKKYRLADIADAEPVPEGERATSTDVEIINGYPKYVHTLESIPVPELREKYIGTIKDAANTALEPIVPNTTAEAAIWDQKVSEAKELRNDTNPNMADYQWIDQQSQKTGIAAGQIANNIIAQHQAFMVYGSQIEAIKIDGIEKINSNTTNLAYYRDNAIYLIDQISVQIGQVT